MQKRNFVLFEILIAFLLVALCIVPLVVQPLKLYRSELQFLEQLERERLADWTFSEIKELLLANGIPWKKLPSKGVKTAPFFLPSATIQIPGSKPKEVERRFTLECKGEKIGLHDEIYRSIWVDIEFLPHLICEKKSHYAFRVVVQKQPIPQ